MLCYTLLSKVSEGQKPNYITTPCSPKDEPEKWLDHASVQPNTSSLPLSPHRVNHSWQELRASQESQVRLKYLLVLAIGMPNGLEQSKTLFKQQRCKNGTWGFWKMSVQF